MLPSAAMAAQSRVSKPPRRILLRFLGVGRTCLLALLASANTLVAQPSQTFRCELRPVTTGGFKGPCLSFHDEDPDESASITIDAGPAAAGPWSGSFYIDRGYFDFELAREDLGDGPTRLVMRTDMEWYTVYEWLEYENGGAVLIFNVLEHALATDVDVAILSDALERLDAVEIWGREDDRNCENDAEGAISLLCLLAESVETMMGRYHHRQPALPVVRRIPRDDWADRVSNHALRDFNNDPRTTLDDVRAVLRTAIEAASREASEQHRPRRGGYERVRHQQFRDRTEKK